MSPETQAFPESPAVPGRAGLSSSREFTDRAALQLEAQRRTRGTVPHLQWFVLEVF